MGWAARTKAGALRFPDAQERQERKLAWRIIATSVSAIPDALYPFDPAVVRAIHEFDRNVIPCFGKRIYKATTGETRAFGFHMVCSAVRDPHYKRQAWTAKVLLPTAGPIVRPTHSDMHIMDGKARKGDGLPGIGAYLPFDWRVYKLLRGMYQEYTAREIAQILQRGDEQTAARRAAAEERASSRFKSDEQWIRRKLANVSKDDLGNLYEQQRKAGA